MAFNISPGVYVTEIDVSSVANPSYHIFSLKLFRWNKFSNTLYLDASHLSGCWTEIVIEKKPFIVESHKTGVRVIYNVVNTLGSTPQTWHTIVCDPHDKNRPVIFIKPADQICNL